MEEPEKQEKEKNVTEVKTLPVPFALEDIKENITVNTKTKTTLSKQELIHQAVKFHLEGNIVEATKYYEQKFKISKIRFIYYLF